MARGQHRGLPKRAERVLDDAEALFIQEGFLHFSTEELARRLRCSKRTIYSIAPSREKFFELIISRHLSRMNENMIAAADAAPNSMAAVAAFLDASIESFGEDPQQFNHDIKGFAGGLRALKRTEHQRLEALEKLIAQGVKAGEFRKTDARLAAHALAAAATRITDPMFLCEVELSWPNALRQLFRLFFQGLLPSREPEELRERNGKSAGLRATAEHR